MNGFMQDLYAAGMGAPTRGRRGGAVVSGVPSDDVTPSALRAALERTRALVDSLRRDVDHSGVSAAWHASWDDFLGRWGAFLEEHPADQDYGLDQLEEALRTLTTYADEARRWGQSFVAAGGALTQVPDAAPRSGVVASTVAAAKRISPLVWLLGGALAVLGAIVVFKGPESE